MNIEQRIQILEKRIGIKEESENIFLIKGKSSYDTGGLRDVLEDNNYKFSEDPQSSGWKVSVPSGVSASSFKKTLLGLFEDEGIDVVLKFSK